MKHIKLFNESNEYYWEVSNPGQVGYQTTVPTGDWRTSLVTGKAKFNDYQKKILKRVKKEDTKLKYHNYNVEITTGFKTQKGGYGKGSWKITTWKSYEILRYDDDWFNVIERDMKSDLRSDFPNMGMDVDHHGRATRACYYTCDQFEGLVKLLKDKGLLK
jgi:hypothetical protein